jgi:hypothetical protein
MGELIIYLLGATITLGTIIYASNKFVDTKEAREILERI